jgi:hypothetical protein
VRDEVPADSSDEVAAVFRLVPGGSSRDCERIVDSGVGWLITMEK